MPLRQDAPLHCLDDAHGTFARSSHQLGEKDDNDVEVTWEDQQNINRFSRLHAAYTDMEDEIRARRREREDLDDLSTELELMDEDDTILYVVFSDTGIKLASRTSICHRVRHLRSSRRTHSA